MTRLFSEIYNIYPEKGRIFSDDEVKSYADVVIIGILPKKGQSSFINFDEVAFIPYTTGQQYVFGIKHFNRIVVEADTESAVAQTVEDVKVTLRNSHNIDNPDKDDFFIETQAEAVQMVSTITNVLTLFLAAVAAISLLVGGIGIMNIMLVSVTERTREIGLRKALGATEKDILVQFLLESVILTAVGGAIGIALGASLSFLISIVLSNVLAVNWAFTFPVGAAALGLGVAAFVGLVFGIYPARQASKKSPIEALRYE
ncbi:MAG: FtsX-like permease family protein [Patescibacteria group bacterium]